MRRERRKNKILGLSTDCDGLTSAVISFMRTLVFQIAAVILFPIIWDIDGIWLSIVGAEIMSIAVTLFFLLIKRRKYGY